MRGAVIALESPMGTQQPCKKQGYKDILTGKYNFQLSEQADLSDTTFYEVILFLWTHLLGFI